MNLEITQFEACVPGKTGYSTKVGDRYYSVIAADEDEARQELQAQVEHYLKSPSDSLELGWWVDLCLRNENDVRVRGMVIAINREDDTVTIHLERGAE